MPGTPFWGVGPSARFASLSEHFRPVFERIKLGSIDRDNERRLPHEEVRWLREAGFQRLRLPVDVGGREVTLPELFGLILELGAADPNLANIARPHLGFTESILVRPDDAWRRRWLERLGSDQTVGSGFSETGEAPMGTFSTRLTRGDDGQVLNGTKFYTTGSLFADWINLAVHDSEGKILTVLVRTDDPGVNIIDDWNGFGQSLTASGTTKLTDVRVTDDMIAPLSVTLNHFGSFPQLVHLATLAGIARSTAIDGADLVRARRRGYGHGNGVPSAQDPQILQVVGRLFGIAYVARSTVLAIAATMQAAYEATLAGDEEQVERLSTAASMETSQSVSTLSRLVLEATTDIFDALGASAAGTNLALDRHWRNARTISSHNPRVYHDRLVGDHVINGAIRKTINVPIGVFEKTEETANS